MTREELATHIFCTYLANPNQGAFHYGECFIKADAFLAYAAQEREKGKPKAECEHHWIESAVKVFCLHCGAPKVKEPTIRDLVEGKLNPPEQRKAREWWANINTMRLHHDNIDGMRIVPTPTVNWIKVREILPEGEG